jgi:hypothetical protein
MKTVVSSDIDLENYKAGNSLSDDIQTKAYEDRSDFKTNPRSPGGFQSSSFNFMDNYKNLISEKQLVKTKYRNSYFNSGNSEKPGEPYHLFFMGSYVTFINIGLDLNKSFFMNIQDHKFNRITVSKTLDLH